MLSGYLLAVTSAHKNILVPLGIMNISGGGQAICGFSKGTVTTDLWIIPKGRRNREEIFAHLQAISAIRSFSMVVLSNPIRKKELTEVRDLFAQISWDSSEVTNEVLSLFLNAKLRGQYSYYIDYDLREKAPRKIRIKRIEDHPDYSPASLKATPQGEETDPDKQYTIDDIRVSSVTLKPNKGRRRSQPAPPDNDQQQKNEGEKNSLL